jgi:hypothetical protein
LLTVHDLLDDALDVFGQCLQSSLENLFELHVAP